jgi:hypothetical protein
MTIHTSYTENQLIGAVHEETLPWQTYTHRGGKLAIYSSTLVVSNRKSLLILNNFTMQEFLTTTGPDTNLTEKIS